MKNFLKLKAIYRIAGIIALVALIGFSMAACDDGGGGGRVPAAPTGLNAYAVSSSEINITWNAVPGADGYRLYYSSSRNGTYSLGFTTSTPNARNYNMPSGYTRYFKATAYNSYGESGYSNIAYATTW
jgi:hypothetical protein